MMHLEKKLRYPRRIFEPKIIINTEKVIFSANLNIKPGKISLASKTEIEVSIEYSVADR